MMSMIWSHGWSLDEFLIYFVNDEGAVSVVECVLNEKHDLQ